MAERIKLEKSLQERKAQSTLTTDDIVVDYIANLPEIYLESLIEIYNDPRELIAFIAGVAAKGATALKGVSKFLYGAVVRKATSTVLKETGVGTKKEISVLRK